MHVDKGGTDDFVVIVRKVRGMKRRCRVGAAGAALRRARR